MVRYDRVETKRKGLKYRRDETTYDLTGPDTGEKSLTEKSNSESQHFTRERD